MINYITKGHIIVLIIGIFSSLGVASLIYQLSNCQNKFIIDIPQPKSIIRKPQTQDVKQTFAYNPTNNIKYQQMNNIPRHMQLKNE